MDVQPDRMRMPGFRAVARTLLDEVLGYRPGYIEHQLAHVVRDPLGRAYNRTAHLPQRREIIRRRSPGSRSCQPDPLAMLLANQTHGFGEIAVVAHHHPAVVSIQPAAGSQAHVLYGNLNAECFTQLAGPSGLTLPNHPISYRRWERWN